MASFLPAFPPISGSPLATKLVVVLSVLLAVYLAAHELMATWSWTFSAVTRAGGPLLSLFPVSSFAASSAQSVDLNWYPPSQTFINNLASVVGGKGVYGFVFNTSDTPAGEYGVYNWCNMPHVRKTEYVVPPSDYELAYVELIHRHHKRTPYASNAFPVEPYHWDCDDAGLHYSGQPLDSNLVSADTYWQGYVSPINPFVQSGWIGTCQFPQITSGGLDDSWQHGQDLYAVYHDLLDFLPGREGNWRSKVVYRVTQNVITSQVAGMVISGMWGTTESVPLVVEAKGVDSLEPHYSCPAGGNLFSTIKSSSNPAWAAHLTAAGPLYAALDTISGVPPSDPGFHASLDHYYDNLSARQCHAKPLPCQLVNGINSTNCVTQAHADTVYRLGNWEYSQVYRDAPASLAACVATFGVWVAELAAHLRAVAAGEGGRTLYVHNVAHDGSVSRLLGLLQVDVMVWPGMGAEVVFEVWRRKGVRKEQSGAGASRFHVRVLWGGRVLNSSSPALGYLDLVPVERLLAYFDGLVGVNASLMLGKCGG